MKKKIKKIFKIKYALMALTILLLGTIVLTYATGNNMSTLRDGVLSIFSPLRDYASSVSDYFAGREEERMNSEELRAKLDEANAKIEELRGKLEQYQSDIYEMEQMRQLLDLKEDFSDYKTTGAKVIGKNSGNWLYEFTIDKGSDDGIEVDMNVLAAGGLAGIVTKVGPNFSVVTSILADDMNVAAVSSTTRDTLLVSGDLELLKEGLIRVMYIHKDASISQYDRIITASTSSKYLPHILIGYIEDIETDNNDLTMSGTLRPAVDFEHLENVLVILHKKSDG